MYTHPYVYAQVSVVYSWRSHVDIGCWFLRANHLHFFFIFYTTTITTTTTIILCVIVGRTCASVHMWKSENNFMKLVLSFHLYLAPWDQAQVLWLVRWVPLWSESSEPALNLFLEKGSLGAKDRLGCSVTVQRFFRFQVCHCFRLLCECRGSSSCWHRKQAFADGAISSAAKTFTFRSLKFYLLPTGNPFIRSWREGFVAKNTCCS